MSDVRRESGTHHNAPSSQDEIRNYDFADRALALRQQAGLTQRERAARLGVGSKEDGMHPLRFRLLGTPLVWRDEQPVQFKTRKTVAALAYLAVEGGVGSREQLAGLLWPGQNLADARKNLRTMLSYVRMGLGDGVIVATYDTVSLSPSALASMDLDLRFLARAQHLARAAEGDGGGEIRAELEQAVALYRGPFLAGLDIPEVPEFETWLAVQRAHWSGVVGEVLERLAGLQAAAGDLGAAQGTIERWVALEPGEERAWQHLLSLALEAGDLVGARRGWMACQEALADLGVEPGEPCRPLRSRSRLPPTSPGHGPWQISARKVGVVGWVRLPSSDGPAR
jgi:DNA-binding SARP family transcriptional activator